ncbi:MAG: DUF1292 domain-containing protein [Lachnospiraceae bacterium]|nr:DUF1292 domain-containing protein [Lachnospiraceae bacterium]
MEKLKFELEDGTVVDFYVEEQTRVNGTNYLLVTDSQDDEADAYILKDISEDEDEVANYVMVEDDVELEALSRVFQEMLDDTEIDL